MLIPWTKLLLHDALQHSQNVYTEGHPSDALVTVCSDADLPAAIRRVLLFTRFNAQQTIHMVTLAALMQTADQCLVVRGVGVLMGLYTAVLSRPALRVCKLLEAALGP